MIAKVPKIVQRCYPSRLWNVGGSEKHLHLTFDDGPIPGLTPWLLDRLKEYDAKATFFCIGENIRKNPEIFQQIVSEGHAIGNHTFNHLNGWKSRVDDYIANTLLAENVISSLIQTKRNKLFRPPYGRISGKQAKILESNGFQIVMWDVLSRDYNKNLSPHTCLRSVLKHTENGSILVFHDSLKAERNVKYVLPAALKHFSREGYSFRKLS